MSSEKPTLPSIQLMLEGAGIRNNKLHHQRNASDVLGDFKSLSLSTPTPMEPSTSTTTPSTTPWTFRPTPLYQHSYQSPRSARNLHSRSYSDYTHPYTTTPPSTMSGLLAPPSPQQQQQQQHRRAVSTSTVEMMLQPTLQPSHSVPSSPTLSIKTPSSQDEETTEEEAKPSTFNNSNNNNNNKYQCPYCQKGFSRPSSLRIHIYSHTGEKPFSCPEPNCDRSFSVQSNMRRHIRVHKLNGKHLKMRKSPPPMKPLAAKPSWMQDTSCLV